ncbi:unnamed protein product [Nezara viridula]|uniref:DUF3668 domain-containing protein n=1 Tax=Nezara viridula TaxID=85310 RepID=A0A9P0MU45_NEZVI|nr:unnamed protein product [Nezara viridula]
MDCYHTSKAQVVVEIKEGNGFTFLTNPVVVVASFNGIQLETKEILPSNCPQFDSELIWQADTKYLRRLRTANTALKLECFTFINNHKQNSRRDRIGYVLLNLKEAQIVTNDEHKSVSETRHRLLGMKNLFQAHKPELVLKFKIEETIKMKSSYEEDLLEKVKVDSNFQCGDSSRLEMFQNHLHGQLHIGPPHLCTEFYELAINVVSAGNLSNIMPKERVDSPITANFVIFGYSFFTKDLSVFRKNMNNGRISIKIWSQLHFIAAYFKEFPKLVISIYSEEDIVGTAVMNLQTWSVEKGFRQLNYKEEYYYQ